MNLLVHEIKPEESKGLKSAFIWVIITIIGIGALSHFVLRGEDGSLIKTITPFVNGMVPLIAIFFFIPGIAYGKTAGTIKNSDDVADYFEETMADMGGYIALAFAAGQFVSYFSWSNLGTILAIKGADFLQAINFTGLPLILVFILVAALINIFIGSATAKWAIMAPVFVPMLMQLDYSPEFAQMAYRIGDSTTNIISPLMPYFAIIIAFAKKYDDELGIGTLISTMLPYSVAFFIAWAVLLVIWFVFNLPIGPGGALFY